MRESVKKKKKSCSLRVDGDPSVIVCSIVQVFPTDA